MTIALPPLRELEQYQWPGNIRELKNAIERANGNETQAGQLLGSNGDQVRYRIEKSALHAHHEA